MNANPVRQLVRLLALLSICLSPSIVSAQVPQYDCMFVFGDSLADNGNVLVGTKALGMNPPVPPSATPHFTYFDGRFSNGYVGVEYLWQRVAGHQPGSPLGLKAFLTSPDIQTWCATNYAFGGTGTPYLDQTPGGFWAPGLKGQVELFRLALRGGQMPVRSLVAISTGANDYRDDPFNVPMKPRDVVRNIEDAIITLYRLGARDVMVVDLPDLGLLPGNTDPNATEISAAHNKLLYAAVARLQARFPELRLILVKLDPLFDVLRAELEPEAPALAVFAPPESGLVACLFVNPATCTDAPPMLFNNTSIGFLFWDVVHPTTEAHRYLGDYMYDQLAIEYGQE